ncbi:DUF885 family protein [Ureaplasma ceti]|uniref:Uncharacterized protein n=1 Tax=Ureaplasma ceti TaxID=3119530 RepID=A0ABP9U6F3_9BACT
MISKRNKKILFTTLGIAATALTVVPLAASLSACSYSNDKQQKLVNPVLDAYSDFTNAKDQITSKSHCGLASDSQIQELTALTNTWLEKFNNLAKNSKELNLNSDQVVWINSIIYNLEQELKNYSTHIQWLGGSSLDNGSTYPLASIQDYVVWNTTGTSLDPQEISANDVNSVTHNLTEYTGYLKLLETNLKEGVAHQVAQSIIGQRLLIGDMLKNFYPEQLEWWANPSHKGTGANGIITINDFINGPSGATDYPKTDFFLQQLQDVKQANVGDVSAYETACENAQKQLNQFITYYVGDYFANAIKEGSDYGFGGAMGAKARPFLYQKQMDNNQEIEMTWTNQAGTHSLYGLGLTEEDLNTHSVGLSFMRNSTAGADLYNHLLELSTTTNKTAEEIFNTGIKDTQNGTANMKALANAVVALETGNKYIDADATKSGIQTQTTWTTNVNIDHDGIGPQAPQATNLTFKYTTDANSADWTKNWTQFNTWLNDEDFFWGREKENDASIFTQKDYDILLGQNTPTQDQLNRYGLSVADYKYWKNELETNGYWTQWNQDNKMYGSIPAKSVLCAAFTEYRDFKAFVTNYAMKYENGRFTKSVSEFGIKPWKYNDRNTQGAGASGGPDDNHFYLNIDPYYGLSKWSEHSFVAHETFLGHRTQGEYVAEHGAKVNNKQGPIFSFSSYAEGWALFVEWFQNQIGAYGKPQAPANGEINYSSSLPSSFKGTDAEGFVAGDLHGNDHGGENYQDILRVKTGNETTSFGFQNGVYWDKLQHNQAYTLKDDKAGWSIATELGNMLQYYGFLNLAQLRNMREAVDTAIHAKFSATSQDGSLASGASINDVRKYLKNNSALDIGNIQAESIRYLVLPGQATSYMTGEHVMEELYTNVNKAYQKTHPNKQLVSDTTAVKKLFDIYLRNGSIPLDALKNEVDNPDMIAYIVDDKQAMISQNRSYTENDATASSINSATQQR